MQSCEKKSMVPIFVRIVTSFLTAFIFSQTQAQDALSFQKALTLAYKNNPEIQAQIQQAEQARGQFVQDGLWLNPSLIFEAENIGGSGDFKGFESAETTLFVNQPLPLGGKRNWQQKASLSRYEQMNSTILRKKAEIYMGLGEAYVNAYYARQWVRITKKLVRLNQDIVHDIQRRLKAGASAELDLQLAEIALGEAQIQQSRAQRAIKKHDAMLARWMGQDELIAWAITDKGIPHHDINWPFIEKSIHKSTFIAEKKAALSAMRVEITSVKKEVWPTMQLQIGGRHFSDDNQNALVASINSVVPAFDRNQGKIIAAEASYTQALQDFRATKLRLYQALMDAHLDLRQNNDELTLIKKKLLPNAEKAVRLAKQGYQQGLYTYAELSNALRSLFYEEQHLQQAHAKRDRAMIKITGLLSRGAR